MLVIILESALKRAEYPLPESTGVEPDENLTPDDELQEFEPDDPIENPPPSPPPLPSRSGNSNPTTPPIIAPVTPNPKKAPIQQES